MGGKNSAKSSPYEDSLSQIAEELYTSTSGLRGDVLTQLEQVMSGQYSPQSSPMFAPLFSEAKKGIEGQYGLARENIMSNVPRGGAQARALAGLEMGRAEQAGSLPAQLSGQIIGDMYNKAYGTAYGAPQQAMSGFGTAASTYGAKQQQAMAANAAEQGAKYQALGMLGGGYLGGKKG